MDFKTVLFLLCHVYFICNTSAQTGSSFFYYYSPNQPMLINSQTFGSNAQAHQQLLPANSNNNPFNLNPSAFQNNNNNNNQPQQTVNGFPTASPFIPHRPHVHNNQPRYEQSSILDKIAFDNAPPTQQPSSPLVQYHDQYPTLAAPTPTTTFPGQPQPSAKLFNFLNQPFQFFQSSFNRFSPSQNGQEIEQQTRSQPQPQQEYIQSYQRPTAVPVPSTTLHQRSIAEEDGAYVNNQQHFYNYYNRFNNQPVQRQRQPQVPVPTQPATSDYDQVNGNTPVSFTSNQYFTRKTTRGPTSYSLTIDADPTKGPTATVHVSMGRPPNNPRAPTQYHLESLPTRFVPLEENVETGDRSEVPSNPENIENVATQQIETEGEQEIIDPSLIYENETETLTTTPKPAEVVIIITESTTENNRIISTTTTATTTTTTTTTTEPEILTSTTPLSTTTTVTTTTIKPTAVPKIDDRKAPKRIIIRKKIPRKRLRGSLKNSTVVSEAKPISPTEPLDISTEQPIISTSARVRTTTERATTTTERPTTTTRRPTRRLRFRTRRPLTTVQPSTTTTTEEATLPPITTTTTTTEAATLPPITTTTTTTTTEEATLAPITTTTEETTLPPITTTSTTTTTEAATLPPATTTEAIVTLPPTTTETVTFPPVTTTPTPTTEPSTLAPVPTSSSTNIPVDDYQYNYDQYDDDVNYDVPSNEQNPQGTTETPKSSTEPQNAPTTSEPLTTTPYYNAPVATTESPFAEFESEAEEDTTIPPLTTSTTPTPEPETESPTATAPSSTSTQSAIESTTETAVLNEQSRAVGNSQDTSYPDQYDDEYYDEYEIDAEAQNKESPQEKNNSEVDVPSSSTTPTPEVSTEEPVTTEPSSTTSSPVQYVTESGSRSTEASSEKSETATEKAETLDSVDPTQFPEEIIEPLSTTEASTSPPVVSTEDTIVIQSTEQSSTPIFDDVPHEELSSSVTEAPDITTESALMTATTESIGQEGTSTTTPLDKAVSDDTPEKLDSGEPLEVKSKRENETLAVDYLSDDDRVKPEAGAIGDFEGKENEATNSTSVNVHPAEDEPQRPIEPLVENNADFSYEYNDNYSAEEEHKNDYDPNAEEKILEAQRQALQNALKNIRNRQNASSTTEKPEDNTSDQPKKFMRRPIIVPTFPSGSGSSSAGGNNYDDEEIGDSRSQILQKIQSFKSKLRRVTSSRSSSVSQANSPRSTTKRPRRVTRPSDRSTSSTQLSEEEEHPNDIPMHKNVDTVQNVKSQIEEKTDVSDDQKPQVEIPEEPKPQALIPKETKPQTEVPQEQPNLQENSPPATNADNSINEIVSPKLEAEELKEDNEQPKSTFPKNQTVHIGELIIHEILPTTSTTTTTTTTTETIIQSTPEISQEESGENKDGGNDTIDFETGSMEDEESHKQENTTPTEPEISSTTETPSSKNKSETATTVETILSTTPTSELSPITATSVSVTTHVSKSESVGQRKVKVILKRRKGAPPGSATIARQVVRTRTRSRPRVSQS